MKRKTDKSFLIISIILGVILGFVLEALYNSENTNIAGNRVICITLYIVVFAVAMGIIILFKSLRDSTFVNFGKVALLTLVAIVALSGCTALFEFLYELNGKQKNTPQTQQFQYVFLIDDSGSMDSNDPTNQRYTAVQSIVNGMKPTSAFAVYTFENETQCQTAMGSSNSTLYTFSKPVENFGGGTYMITAIDDVIESVAKNDIHTKIITLTDGVPSDKNFISYNKVLKKCLKKNVSVSSVGFGTADEVFLKDLADGTGGVYVFSNDIASLTSSLETVVNKISLPTDKNRDLLGNRYDHTYGSFLYGFLRVLFLIVLGVLWSIVKLLLIGEKRFSQSSAVLSIALCSIAAILCELLLLAGISDGFVRILLCALWACTLIIKPVYQESNISDILHNGSGNQNTGDIMKDFNTKSKEVEGPKSFL